MQSHWSQVKKAAAELRRGGVVAFPTETVYGLGAVAFDDAAVAKVFALKGRPAHNPLIVHVVDTGMAKSTASAWPEVADRLAEAFWPGPLSIVVPRNDRVPGIVTAGGSTVCVRCPDHPLTLALLEAVELPLVGPSANRSGGVSPTTADHVRNSFDGLFVLDGGACRIGIESTVVRPGDRGIEILRPGAIGVDELKSATGEDVVVAPHTHRNESALTLQSPGLLNRHYATEKPTRLVTRDGVCAINLNTTAFITQETIPDAPYQVLMPSDSAAYSAALYSALRTADAMSAERIVILEPRGEGPSSLWLAIADRIARACTPETGSA